MDRKDLKIEAYRQRVSQIVTEYEEKCADYRIEITELDEQSKKLQEQLANTQQELEEYRNREAQQKSAVEAVDADEVSS